MTLDTRMIIFTPGTDADQVFDFGRWLLSADEHIKWEHRDKPITGKGVFSNHPGQGLPGWLFTYYDDHWVEFSIDTGYGYQSSNGAHAGDLHAWMVFELGIWLEEAGIRYLWYNESAGTWHEENFLEDIEDEIESRSLRDLGDKSRGALPVNLELRPHPLRALTKP